MNVMTTARTFAASNIDKRIVVSSMIGAGLLGLATFAAVKSGIRPLATAAKIAKTGKKGG